MQGDVSAIDKQDLADDAANTDCHMNEPRHTKKSRQDKPSTRNPVGIYLHRRSAFGTHC